MSIRISPEQADALRDALRYSTTGYGYGMTVTVGEDGVLTFSSDRYSVEDVTVGGIPQSVTDAVAKGLDRLTGMFSSRAVVKTMLGDLSTINLNSTDNCILGRIFSPLAQAASETPGWQFEGFSLGMRALFGSGWADESGIRASDYGFAEHSDADHETVMRAWAKALA